MGTPSAGCDIIPALRSGFQMLQQVSKKSRREVERRQIRGRDGGPSPCGGRGSGARGIPGNQGEAGKVRIQGGPAEQEARARLKTTRAEQKTTTLRPMGPKIPTMELTELRTTSAEQTEPKIPTVEQSGSD